MAEGRKQLFLLSVPGRKFPGERLWADPPEGFGMSSWVKVRGVLYAVDHFASFGSWGAGVGQAVYMAGPKDEGDLPPWLDAGQIPELLREPEEPAEPPWPGQRFYAPRGKGRAELRALRQTDAALPMRVGAPIILGKRRYVVSAVEDDGDTVLLDPA